MRFVVFVAFVIFVPEREAVGLFQPGGSDARTRAMSGAKNAGGA
jgi:hypothetical protein